MSPHSLLALLPLAARLRQTVPAAQKLLVVNGHPDPHEARFCAALARAYAQGARDAGHAVRELAAGALPSALWSDGANPLSDPASAQAIALLRWAERCTFVFPLWLNRPPACLTRLCEAADWAAGLTGAGAPKPARLVVTMQMPALTQRQRRGESVPDSLALAGMAIEEVHFIGCVGLLPRHDQWLGDVEALGRDAARQAA